MNIILSKQSSVSEMTIYIDIDSYKQKDRSKIKLFNDFIKQYEKTGNDVNKFIPLFKNSKLYKELGNDIVFYQNTQGFSDDALSVLYPKGFFYYDDSLVSDFGYDDTSDDSDYDIDMHDGHLETFCYYDFSVLKP